MCTHGERLVPETAFDMTSYTVSHQRVGTIDFSVRMPHADHQLHSCIQELSHFSEIMNFQELKNDFQKFVKICNVKNLSSQN